MPMTLEIPESAISASRLSPKELRRELQQELAVALYGRGILPIGKAMELAGATRREFETLLSERRMAMPSDEDELARELS